MADEENTSKAEGAVDTRRVLHEWTEQPAEEFRAAGSVTFQLLDATVPWSRFEIRSLREDVASGNHNSTALIASLLVRAEHAEAALDAAEQRGREEAKAMIRRAVEHEEREAEMARRSSLAETYVRHRHAAHVLRSLLTDAPQAREEE